MVFAGSELELGSNSIKCMEWVHKRYSGISESLKSNVDFHRRRCLEKSPAESESIREVEI